MVTRAETVSYLIEPTESDKKKYFFQRLIGWRNERPWFTHFFEWNARRKIVNAIKRDISNQEHKIVLTKEQRIALVAGIFKKLDTKSPVTKEGLLIDLPKVDAVTGQINHLRITRSQTGYQAGEYNSSGLPFTLVEFNKDGTNSLLLNYGQFQESQNPHIVGANNTGKTGFDIAAGAVFNLLSNSAIHLMK